MEININLTFANFVCNGWIIHFGWDCKQFTKASLTAKGVLNFEGTLESTIRLKRSIANER
ncbi:MAG: hypothetical protein ACTS6P_01440 [Candidatus Hodgkinia cicadicola]